MADNVTFENAQIRFRNFRGEEGKYNRAGDRNFVVFLEPEDAANLSSMGWNVKELQPRDPQDSPQAYIQVSVSYKGRPPKIMMVTSGGKTPVDEQMVDVLDYAEIKTVDLIVNPYEWEVNGKTGIKAYLKSMFVTLVEDDLDRKYADIPDNNSGAPQPVEDDFNAPF